MPSTQKRRTVAATAAWEPKAKRQQREDPLAVKCDVVLGALRSAEGFPEASLQILEVGARSCLRVPKESRHSVQNSVIEMLREVLESVEAGLDAKVGALRCKIAEAGAERRHREATAEAATATVQETSAGLAVAERALEDASAATLAAKESRRVAVSGQQAGDADFLIASEKSAKAEQVFREDLCPLMGGSCADIDRSIKRVATVCEALGLEAQLIRSAEVVLRKAPGERGSFDSMVAQQMDGQFGKAIAKLREELASVEDGKSARLSRVDDCTKHVDAAVVHRVACQKQLEVAKAALKAAEAAGVDAEKAVADLGPEMDSMVARSEAADAILLAHRAGMATFTELVEGPLTAPEVVGEAHLEAVQVV